MTNQILCKSCTNQLDEDQFELKKNGNRYATCNACRAKARTPEFKNKRKAYVAKKSKEINAKRRAQYANDPQYQQAVKSLNAKWRETNRDAIRERERIRGNSGYYAELWTRLKNDPDKLSKRNEGKRNHYHSRTNAIVEKANLGDWTGFTKRMWLQTKQRATKEGIPFSIAIEDIQIPAVCPVLGLPLIASSKKYHDAKPSIDKIVPELGYVAGNIRVISFRANRMKSDLTVADLDRIRNYILESAS